MITIIPTIIPSVDGERLCNRICGAGRGCGCDRRRGQNCGQTRAEDLGNKIYSRGAISGRILQKCPFCSFDDLLICSIRPYAAARSAHRTLAIDLIAKGYFPAQALTYLVPFLFAQIIQSLPHRSNLATDSTSHRASSRSSNCTPYCPTQSPRKVTQLVSDNLVIEQYLKTFGR